MSRPLNPAELAAMVKAGDRRGYIRAWVAALKSGGCGVVYAYWIARRFWESYK